MGFELCISIVFRSQSEYRNHSASNLAQSLSYFPCERETLVRFPAQPNIFFYIFLFSRLFLFLN